MALPLLAGEAHLFYLFPDEISDPAALARYRTWMTAEECARCDRYHFEHSRREYLLTRALVRAALSLYDDAVPPAAWTFTANSHGRPALTGPTGQGSWRFNLSNTRGLIALLIMRDRDVGIDVEATDRPGETVELAESYFAPAEVAALRALPASARRGRFFEYWTLKEAYIKARGLGLSIPLDQFAFLLDPADAPIRIAFDPRLDDDPGRWQFAQLALGPRHAAAVALPSGAVELRIYRLVPGMEPISEGPGKISRR